MSDLPVVLGSLPQAARMLRISVQRVQQFQEKGVLKRYPVGKVDLMEVAGDMAEHQRRVITGRATEAGEAADRPGLERERERLAKEQADKLELENALTRRELIRRSPVRDALAAQDQGMKDRLLMVPLTGAAEALAAGKRAGAPGIADVYANHINRALADLASAELVAAPTAH